MTAEDVFRAAGLGDGPNAAPRLLKLIAGLNMFPREQQLAMVHAMDAADESWSEQEVLADAQQRLRALELHLEALGAERQASLGAIEAEGQQTRQAGQAVLEEIDRQIAALYARRQQETTETATALATLETRQQETLRSEENARRGIQTVMQALGGLMAFFGVNSPASRRAP
jgi:hypothetical protein